MRPSSSDSSITASMSAPRCSSCSWSSESRPTSWSPSMRWAGTTFSPNSCWAWATTASKSARAWSSLVTTTARGMLTAAHSRHNAFVGSSTPSLAATTNIAASAARSPARSSPTKST